MTDRTLTQTLYLKTRRENPRQKPSSASATKALKHVRDLIAMNPERNPAHIHVPPARPLPGSTFNKLGPTGSGWCEAAGLKNLRFVGYADELTRLKHNGWFADAHQDTVCRGVVYLLPQRSEPQRRHLERTRTYLVGHEDPDNHGCAYLEHYEVDYSPDTEDDGHAEAAHRADQIAERYAEAAREYDEAWQENSWLVQKAEAVREAAEARGE